MFRYAFASAAVAALAAPAFAGGPTVVYEEPAVMAPIAVAPPSYDWTGFYVGGQLGWGSATGEGTNDFDGIDIDASGGIGGLTAGYRHDLGNWVVGGEVQYDWAHMEVDDIDFGGITVDVDDGGQINSMWRVKGQAGYDLGRTLVYGTAGWAQATVEVAGDETSGSGWLVGGGVDYAVTDSFTVGGELLYHRFDEFGDGDENFDLSATTIQAKATFRF